MDCGTISFSVASAATYVRVNRARLVLMRACAERLLTEGADA